jgi:hypothetical protein
MDLNVDNYTRVELIEIFQLPLVFYPTMVETHARRIQTSILQNKNLNEDIRQFGRKEN